MINDSMPIKLTITGQILIANKNSENLFVYNFQI